MSNESSELNIPGLDLRLFLQDLWQTLRRLWLLLAAALIICVSALCWRTYRTYRPVYKASATFTVYVTNALQSEIRSYNTTTAEQMAKTFPYILTSGALSERVMQELSISSMPSVSASVLSNTNIFTLTVTSNDAQLAYNVLQSVIRNYPEVAEFVVGPTVMNLLDASGVPHRPGKTRDYRQAAKRGENIAAVIWLAVSFVLTMLRSTVHNEEELKKLVNLRVLGVLPQVRGQRKTGYLIYRPNDRREDHPGFMEAVRLMRIRTEKQMQEQDARVLLVSSATAGEGKTTVAANLAAALAAGGARTLLIDCDLRSPSVAESMRQKNAEGFVEYLRKGASCGQIIRQSPDNKNLFYIFAGSPCRDAAELLSKPEAKTFVDACRKPFQYVILDTPPAGLLADASEAAALADAAILTVRQNYASKTQILEAVRSLTDSELPILGCVINYATGSTLAGGYYGYGYGKGYRGYGEKETSARGR